MAEARVPSDPPSKPTIAITLNTLHAVHLSVVTVSFSMLGSFFIPRVMDLCFKPDTILNLTFGEMLLDISQKFSEIGISRSLNMNFMTKATALRAAHIALAQKSVF